MGATDISGSFSSSDWKVTINQLKQQATRYIRLPDGSYEEDEDCFYDGSIYSINHWRMVEMHGKSKQEIMKYLDRALYNIEKCEGLVVEANQVGYDIYRPTFESMNRTVPGYAKYFNNRLIGCVLLEKRHIQGSFYTWTKSRDVIEVIQRGSLEECKQRAAECLYSNTDKTYIICSSTGKLTKCYNSVRRVKDTTQRSQYGKLKIKPVYNYYWMGIAAE